MSHRDAVLDWFARRQRPDWSAQDERSFEAWLAESPTHGAAYQQWQQQWAALAQLPSASVDRWRAQAVHGDGDPTPSLAPTAWPLPSRSLTRRSFVAPLGVMAVAGGAGALVWQQFQRPVFVQRFSTQRGQQGDVPLPDGSQLHLDTATQVAVAYYRQRREVRLLDGQLICAVTPDATRPFHVLAGASRVTVVGTRFSVRYLPGFPGEQGAQVAVESGRVRVARVEEGADQPPEAWAEGGVLLSAGQRVSSDRAGTPGLVGVVAAEGIAPWRDQRLSFVDTPLGLALAELERYGRTGLVLHDPRVAALRLSGTFDPRDSVTFRRLLVRALPVRLRDRGSAHEVQLAH